MAGLSIREGISRRDRTDMLAPTTDTPHLLFETADNPMPDNAFAGMLTMRDGKRLRYARFGATGRPLKGTVVIFTGRNECIEKYFETIRDLAARGFSAAIFDWRGQGGSDRLIAGPPRGYVRNFQQYLADIEPFFQDVVLPDCRAPFYLLGHSTGALIALMAASEMSVRVRRMVLCAPLLEFRDLPLSTLGTRRLTGFLRLLGLGRMVMSGRDRKGWPAPFATNKLTSDPDRYRRNLAIYEAHPELATGKPSVTWVHAACAAALQVQQPDFLTRLRIPSLFVAAGADTVVSTPTVEAYGRYLRGASVVTIDGARHEILQEGDVFREQFWAAFDAFIPGSDGTTETG
jgi:lysophospholipase